MPDFVFINDYPRGLPLLQKLLKQLGITKYSILSAFDQVVPKNKYTNAEFRELLKGYRETFLQKLTDEKPKCIIPLGDTALQQTLKKSGITKHRGKWFSSKEFNVPVLPVFHPSYCERNIEMLPLLQADLQKLLTLQADNWVISENENRETNYIEADTIRPLIEAIKQKKIKIISFDTETNGLDYNNPHSRVVCYSIGIRPGQAIMVRLYREDVTGKGFPTLTNTVDKTAKTIHIEQMPNFHERLQELYELLSLEGYKLVMMNGNFDRHFCNKLFIDNGLSVPSYSSYYMDIQAAAHVCNEMMYKQASLEDIQFTLTDIKSDYSQSFKKRFGYSNILAIPVNELQYYACADADVTLQGAISLSKELGRSNELNVYYHKFVQPALNTLYEIEKNGCLIDIAAIPKAEREINKILNDLEKRLYKLIPAPIRRKHEGKLLLTRTDLLRDCLFDARGYRIKPLKYTKNKAISVDKDVRKELLDRDIPNGARAFLESLEEWSELHTLFTRYLAGFTKHVKGDNRIHSRFSLVVTKTGRIASSDPNMMNNPKRSTSAKVIRRLLIAPPGKVLLALDESQSELRWAAHLSGDPNMKRVFQEGRDIHTATAEAITGKKASEMDESELKRARQNAKPVNFGVLYLMSPSGFVTYAKKEYGVVLSEHEADQWIMKWFRNYPMVRRYHKETIEFCKKHGYVKSPLGRRRRLSETNSTDRGIANAAMRQAVNHPIQSASSDTVILALSSILQKKLLDPAKCKLINFIHDEVIFECIDNSTIIDESIKIIKHELEYPDFSPFGFELSVPLVSDAKIGPNLAEMVPF